MNRSLKLSMLVALALGTSQALAMDLGQVQVKSALGQPLLAEIPLHPANPSELKNLTVKLASSEEFARAGIVGGRTSIPLHFRVANTGDGHQVIRITSSAAVDNPYLDLLIEVNGSAGKSVREFAILLDPPHAPMAAPTVAPAPKAATPNQRVASRSIPVPPRRSAPAQTPAPQTSVVNGKYGPVEHGQTLSGIARSTAPSGVDVQQMILALQQANPDAFYRENINALKSGAVLRVPTAAEAQAMTIAAALAEIRRQNSDWRAGTPGKPAVVAAAATRAPAAKAPGNRDNSDRLALVPAKEGGNGATGQGGETSGKSASSVRQDLMRAKESVVSLQQQSTDLKGQLKDLSDINSKNDRLLSLKDNEIAELQSKLAAARKTAGLPPMAVPVPASAMTAAKPAATKPLVEGDLATATANASVNPDQTPVSSGSSALASAAMASAASAPKASTPATVVPAKPAVKKPVVGKPAAPAAMIEQPWYMQTWAWAVGAGAVLLLILLAMLGRRKRAVSDLSKASLADRFGSAPAADADVLDAEDLDQEELLDQLAEHPDDIGLHLELVTLYYSRRDVEHFEAAAEAMHAHITDPEQDEWQDVLNMGEDLVPEHPLFDHHPELPAREDAEARREFDIDDYVGDQNSAPDASTTLPPDGPKQVSEYHFNFDLTRPAADESSADVHLPAYDEIVAAPLLDEVPVSDTPIEQESESTWQFKDSTAEPVADSGTELGEFSDDPIDTKLDLARAYLDMGDADGARAMLGEVMKEGSQMQRDTAKRLLDDIS
ncbi:MAG: FimV/HubP family polar landmark protein [Rhodanobacter sp.]